MFVRHRRMSKVLCLAFLFVLTYKVTTWSSSTSAPGAPQHERHSLMEFAKDASYSDNEDAIIEPKTEILNIRPPTEILNIRPPTEILNIRPSTEILNIRPPTEIPTVQPKTEVPKVQSNSGVSNFRKKIKIRHALPTTESEATSTEELHAVERMCPMYQEFRRMDFKQPAIRKKLCRKAEAYRRYRDGYPMCLLPHPFDEDMLTVAREGSEVVELWYAHFAYARDVLPMYVYTGNDFISGIIRTHHAWEPQLVRWTLQFALKLPDVTFLDMGSNIGVYSLQAAKLGLPVVALDANIRNLLRLRLSLNASSLDAALVWNFIAADQSLKYLSFLADCNVGGAGRDNADLPDTVPVMPLRSERICDLIKTKNVVIKIDIQGGEADFLLTSGRLFTDFNVALVQMEWYPPMIRGNDSEFIRNYLSSRDYKVFRMPDFHPLDPEDPSNWGVFMDVFWVRQKYLQLFGLLSSENIL